MSQQEKDRVFFVAWLLDKVAEECGKLPADIYRSLQQANIVDDYVIPSYDVLHTMGADALVEDIRIVAALRGGHLMILYHGSTMEISRPLVSKSRSYLDFGKGFYMTSFAKQATNWAQRKARMRRQTPIVNQYVVSDDLNGIRLLRFVEPDACLLYQRHSSNN